VYFALRFSTYNCNSLLRENKQKLHIAYLTSWNNSIFSYKLRFLWLNVKKIFWLSVKALFSIILGVYKNILMFRYKYCCGILCMHKHTYLLNEVSIFTYFNTWKIWCRNCPQQKKDHTKSIVLYQKKANLLPVFYYLIYTYSPTCIEVIRFVQKLFTYCLLLLPILFKRSIW